MKAAICTKYGPPEVIQIKEVAKPVPKDNELLIKIHAATCHIGDVRVRSFDVPLLQKLPFRLYLGLTKPKRSILGMELAGEIESVGREVKKFNQGDQVFATTGFEFGAHAEYRCLPEETTSIKHSMVTAKPVNLSYEEAAAGITTGGITALMILRKGKLRHGQRLLVYGASGSVGSYAIQIAKHYGAVVTGVCSTANMEMVKSLGADEVIDYTKEDFVRPGESYDIVFDAVNKLSASHGKKSLAISGKYLNVDRDSGAGDNATIDDLELLRDLAEEGKLKPVIDRSYPLDQIVEAHRYVERGHKRGHVVINVVSGGEV